VRRQAGGDEGRQGDDAPAPDLGIDEGGDEPGGDEEGHRASVHEGRQTGNGHQGSDPDPC
jgi:hypothetical protein